MSSFNPGDVAINYITMTSPRGFLDLGMMFLSCEIYESVYTPGIVGYFEVLDTDDLLGEYKVAGDEIVTISFNPPGGIKRIYQLNLNSVNDVTQEGSMKSKIYKLTCLSVEAFSARSNLITKSYNTQISNMVQDVFSQFLGSNKSLNIEPTKGIHKFLTNNKKPYNVIKELANRATSLNSKSSLYLFFENALGFNFVTFEKLFQGNIIKYLKRVDTVGSSFTPQSDNNIIAYKLYRQGSAIDRIGLGSLNNQVQTYDYRTRSFDTKKSKPSESDYGISGAISSAFFKNLFGKNPGQSIFVSKDSMQPETYMNESSSDKKAYLAALMQNQLNVEVPGDTVFYAGGCVFCDIPKVTSMTGNIQTEQIVYGKFVISKLAHIIRRNDKRPRYINSMELIKAGFENGV